MRTGRPRLAQRPRRYADALAAAEEATRDAQVFVSILVVPELVEAAARTGNTDVAAAALRRLEETTQPSGNDLALGIEARCRALLSDGETADRLYQEAISRLGRTQLRPDLARAHLLYGEWLRRQGRRTDAREQLRRAHEMLSEMGAEAFAERAARELLATGETARKRTDDTRGQLTAQETQIARLARGLLEPRDRRAAVHQPADVEYHLHKVFAKLEISSRNELQRVLPSEARRSTAGVAGSRRGSAPRDFVRGLGSRLGRRSMRPPALMTHAHCTPSARALRALKQED
jgi:hypothetical protein